MYVAWSVTPIKAHAFVEPDIAPGVALIGAAIVNDLSALTKQFDIAFTFISDAVKALLNVMTTLVVPCPLTNVVFAGNVHIYDVAFVTAAIEYVACVVVPIY